MCAVLPFQVIRDIYYYYQIEGIYYSTIYPNCNDSPCRSWARLLRYERKHQQDDPTVHLERHEHESSDTVSMRPGCDETQHASAQATRL